MPQDHPRDSQFRRRQVLSPPLLCYKNSCYGLTHKDKRHGLSCKALISCFRILLQGTLSWGLRWSCRPQFKFLLCTEFWPHTALTFHFTTFQVQVSKEIKSQCIYWQSYLSCKSIQNIKKTTAHFQVTYSRNGDHVSRGPYLEGPEMFSQTKSCSNSQTFTEPHSCFIHLV